MYLKSSEKYTTKEQVSNVAIKVLRPLVIYPKSKSLKQIFFHKFSVNGSLITS